MIAAMLAVGALSAHAQAPDLDSRFSVKAHGEIGAGGGLSLTTSEASATQSTSMNSFGVDFGYMFWQQNGMSLSVNAGLDYDLINARLGVGSMKYDYAAGADADMDGDTYRRYYELGDLSQKTTAGYLSIPVYVNFTYRFNEWVGLYANVGVKPGFKAGGKIKSLDGEVYSYGVYPQYDDLMMDDEWLNDFGRRELTKSDAGEAQINGLNMSILAGIGAEVRIYGPLYGSLGVNYNAGVTDVFKYDSSVGSDMPLVSYTVADGQRVQSLTSMYSKSKISHLGINIALIYRF